MLINYISNLPADLRSGGFSAMNVAACEAIGKAHDVHYAGPINPRPLLRQKLASKVLRTARQQGSFFFYSKRRLGNVAALVDAASGSAADMDFFHGFTPWIATRPSRPYIAWSDCSFRDYISLYHHRPDFRTADLDRIERQEALWLKGASAIGFTSSWAAKRAIRDYALDPAQVHVVGIFGEAEWPDTDAFSGGEQFAFISTDFKAKGGQTVLAAHREVSARHANASLVVVGDIPTGLDVGQGVFLAGFLRKENPNQNQRLRHILATSRAVVLPTRSDIAPLLLVEAGYFGCPVISARSFAIPEIVEDGVTGILVENVRDVSAVAAAMNAMVEGDGETYLAMRKATWIRSREMHSRARFESRLLAMIETMKPKVP